MSCPSFRASAARSVSEVSEISTGNSARCPATLDTSTVTAFRYDHSGAYHPSTTGGSLTGLTVMPLVEEVALTELDPPVPVPLKSIWTLSKLMCWVVPTRPCTMRNRTRTSSVRAAKSSRV